MTQIFDMFVQVLCFSLKFFLIEGHYYPSPGHQYFSQQSQAVFQGASSSFGFGFGPGPGFVHESGGSHGQYNPQGQGIHGGWSPYPPPFNFLPVNPQLPDVTVSSNDLKPSITGWDTTYDVPCGSYTIHPFVVAHIRYTSGSHTVGYASSAKSESSPSRQRRSFPPLYPFHGGGPTTCSWNFHSYGTCKLKFTCSWFQLPALFQCDENVMELTDSDQFTYKFCGSRKPRGTYISTSESIRLTFKSHTHSLPSIFDCSVSCSLESAAVLSSGKDESSTEKPSHPHPSLGQQTTVATSESQPQPQTQPAEPAKTMKYGQCKCGARGSISTGRIVGGRKTFPGEFPWTAALVKKNSHRPFCGGSLINNGYVVSAAHCVQNRKQGGKNGALELQVLLNEHDISKISEFPGGTIRANVAEIMIHPKYDNFTYNYDVALLRLEKQIDFPLKSNHCKNDTERASSSMDFARMENKFESQFVPICLPGKAEGYTGFDDTEGVVTGWGLTKEGGIPSNSMMQAVVHIFNDTFCQDFYRAKDVVTKQMICAGHLEGTMDSCVGDSGGPLVVSKSGHYTLAGIVSWGRGCGRPNLPGVYTRMSGLTEWIESEAQDAIWCEP